jgi:hypothetical protein
MLTEPDALALDQIEDIEKATMRLVTQAIYDFRATAAEIFANETDKPDTFGEEITREALDRMGVSKIEQRLFGKIDYKRARYVFDSRYAVRQAFFVDSKVEKDEGVARLQTGQTSMRIMYRKQTREREEVVEAGTLPAILVAGGHAYLTTTIFVKYNYDQIAPEPDPRFNLTSITIAAAPNGLLQDRYNPDSSHTIWQQGPQSDQRGERFRVRLKFDLLKAKARWRVQHFALGDRFVWDDELPLFHLLP